MKARINQKEVNHQLGSFIVLEAGPTHNGIESAKSLALMAKEAGADAVKFQMLTAARLMSDKTVMFEYKVLEKDADNQEIFVSVSEPLYEILKRRELSKSEWIELKQYCDDIDIAIFSTATYEDEVDFLVDELGIDSIKIASGDINELDFIAYCARKGVNIQIDTGNADLWEIERAVICAENEGCDNIIIHLCPSGYPAHLESIHLRMLKTLQQMFPNYSIAFSDHSPGWDMDIAAVALGADMVEKTITLDRSTRSCEHSFSLEKSDAIQFVKSIRNVEKALGQARRTIPKEIHEKRNIARRSPYALRSLSQGDLIQKQDFEFRRPSNGLNSDDFKRLIGKSLIKDLGENQALNYDYI